MFYYSDSSDEWPSSESSSDDSEWECCPCDRTFRSKHAYQQHLDNAKAHNHRCRKCVKVFWTENQLQQHMLVHKPRVLECWGSSRGCDRSFKTPAHIFLHLETGTCNSGITTRKLFKGILKCRGPWKNRDYNSDDFPFQCPTCDRQFEYISGFVQHIESPSCDEGYYGGRESVWGLFRQLRRNLGLDQIYLYGRTV